MVQIGGTHYKHHVGQVDSWKSLGNLITFRHNRGRIFTLKIGTSGRMKDANCSSKATSRSVMRKKKVVTNCVLARKGFERILFCGRKCSCGSTFRAVKVPFLEFDGLAETASVMFLNLILLLLQLGMYPVRLWWTSW